MSFGLGLSLLAAADRWHVPPEFLLTAARRGCFPASVAWQVDPIDDRWEGWRFTSEISRSQAREAIRSETVYVPVVSEDVAQMTASWCAELDRETILGMPDTGLTGDGDTPVGLWVDSPPDVLPAGVTLEHVLDWVRFAAPDPLSASPATFAWWCACYPRMGFRPGGATVGWRFAAVTAWFEMLTDSGVYHSMPVGSLRVTVNVAEQVRLPAF